MGVVDIFSLCGWLLDLTHGVVVCLCVRLFVRVRGYDSARWPSSIPPGGVAQVGLLIPVISSKFGVDGGGVE